MGEYALYNHEQVKIGTCEDMYYLRYEDRFKVSKLPGNVDPVSDATSLRFRLPFPDEDNIQPGGYEEYNRYERLYAKDDTECRNIHIGEDSTGIIQLTHKDSGLLLNVPCHHGQKLPEVGPNMKAFWNGKGHALVLSAIRPTEEGVKPIVRCRFCDHAWRFDWADVFPYVQGEMRARLRAYAEAEDKAVAA